MKMELPAKTRSFESYMLRGGPLLVWKPRDPELAINYMTKIPAAMVRDA